jgi:hypothetical protein
MSKAVRDTSFIDPSLEELTSMIRMEGRYIGLTYRLIALGTLFFLVNLGILLFGDPLAKWGPVYDSLDHHWSFVAGRIHLFYSWIIIMPLAGHVVIFSSRQLRKAMKIASRECVLTYDFVESRPTWWFWVRRQCADRIQSRHRACLHRSYAAYRDISENKRGTHIQLCGANSLADWHKQNVLRSYLHHDQKAATRIA